MVVEVSVLVSVEVDAVTVDVVVDVLVDRGSVVRTVIVLVRVLEHG